MDWTTVTIDSAATGEVHNPTKVEPADASPSAANTSSVSLSTWRQLVGDKWIEIDPKDVLIKELSYGPYVAKDGDVYCCGNDEVYKRLAGKKRDWIWKAIDRMIASVPAYTDEQERDLLNRVSQIFPGACVSRRLPERGGWLNLTFGQLLGSL